MRAFEQLAQIRLDELLTVVQFYKALGGEDGNKVYPVTPTGVR